MKAFGIKYLGDTKLGHHFYASEDIINTNLIYTALRDSLEFGDDEYHSIKESNFALIHGYDKVSIDITIDDDIVVHIHHGKIGDKYDSDCTYFFIYCE